MNSHLLKLSVGLLALAVLVSACGGAPATPVEAVAPAQVPHWWVVTASSDNTARVWDAASGETVAMLQGHTGPVLSAAFSPDGKLIVSRGLDTTARLYDAATGEDVLLLGTVNPDVGHGYAPINTPSFSPDGKFVVTAGEQLGPVS